MSLKPSTQEITIFFIFTKNTLNDNDKSKNIATKNC